MERSEQAGNCSIDIVLHITRFWGLRLNMALHGPMCAFGDAQKGRGFVRYLHT